jgi:hypothetical protein
MHSRGGFHAEGRIDLHAKGGGRAQAGAEARGRASASGRGKIHKVPGSDHDSCEGIGRAKRPVAFVGRISRVRGAKMAPLTRPDPQRARTRRRRQPAGQQAPEDQPPADQPPAEPPPADPPPADEPPPAAEPPPDEPPPNVFGYDRPVLGCLEGQVYFIPADSTALPADYSGLDSSAVLYACEWDIPTRAWEAGFPDLPDRFEWFAIRYSGAFHVAAAGTYRFRLSSDDGAKLTIDGQVVVDNDGVHPPREGSGEIDLTEGDHTIVLEYFQGPRYHINLQLFVTPPGGEEGLFSVRSE